MKLYSQHFLSLIAQKSNSATKQQSNCKKRKQFLLHLAFYINF